MTQDWITRAMHRADATARPGSDGNMPDTTNPKIAKTTIRLQLLANTGVLYQSLSIMVGGQLRIWWARGSWQQFTICSPLLSVTVHDSRFPVLTAAEVQRLSRRTVTPIIQP